MENASEMYLEETNPANEIKGFTTSFKRKSKEKKGEDQNVKDLLSFRRDGRLFFGTKVTEKAFKRGTVEKVYTASNCESLTLRKIKHYAKIADVPVVELDLDKEELSQKLGKPFLISMTYVGGKK